MNNRPDDRARLLADTLEGSWTDGPAAVMAQRAAAHARRRRAMRQISVALLVALTAAAALWTARRPAPSASMGPVAAAKPAYEIISDEELLAALRDRPVLVLPQENGTKKIVLLDQ